MTVVVLAYHQMGCVCLRTLLRRRVPVSGVFTYDDDPDENCWFDSVRRIASDAGLPVWITETINSPEWVARIGELAPAVIFSFHYRHLLKRPLLEIPRRGAVNLHASLLPRYRGRAPINWQLVHGERESGVTLHYMSPGADTGDIIGQEPVAVGPDDTALDLYRKLLPAAETVLDRHLDGILDGVAPRQPQDESRATTFGRRTAEDGRIDWARPAREIHDLVRAVAPPWPGAFCGDGADGVRILRTRILSPGGAPDPGVVRIDDGRVIVGTGAGTLELVDYEIKSGTPLRTGMRLPSRGEPCASLRHARS